MGGVDKIFLPLAGAPVLAHTILAFEAVAAVQQVAVVLSPGNLEAGRRLVAELRAIKVAAVVSGGARRQDSARAGLAALAPSDLVLIHDVARPLVTGEVIERCIAGAVEQGAVVAAVPATDTVKQVEPAGRITQTLDRTRLWLAQTPQAFRRALIERAYAEVVEDATDDAAMVEKLGQPVYVALGDPANLKITTPADVALAEALLAARR